MVFQGFFQVKSGVILVEHLFLQSLDDAMDVINIISEYNLLTLSLYDLICISFCCFWRISLAELDHPLSFGVSLSWKLINSVGLFLIFNS